MSKADKKKRRVTETAIGVFVVVLFVIALVNFRDVPFPSSQRITEKATVDRPARDQSDASRTVHMQGRSVMAGWFDFWGSDAARPAARNGYQLHYQELSAGPDLASSSKQHLRRVRKGSAVFFKLCFEDFEGGSRESAEQNLRDNIEIVGQVLKEVQNSPANKLIIGNALPQTGALTDKWLVWNHDQYNKWLLDLATRHPKLVVIFDQYRVLAGSKGAIQTDYAVDQYDSHLNESAYQALDRAFFSFLRKSL